MVRAAHAAISCFDIMFGQGSIAKSVRNNINNINGLSFYH
jgi:hypothetical protein